MTDSHSPLDCRSVIEELYTYLDGELTEAKRLEISGHLTACVDCHEVVDFYAELKMTISQRCREEVPAHLRQKVLDSITGERRRRGIPRS